MDSVSDLDALVVSQMKQNIGCMLQIRRRHAAQEACADRWTHAEIQQLFELISQYGEKTRYHTVSIPGKSTE